MQHCQPLSWSQSRNGCAIRLGALHAQSWMLLYCVILACVLLLSDVVLHLYCTCTAPVPQVDTVVQQCLQALADGHCPVIGLQSTGEARTAAYVKEAQANKQQRGTFVCEQSLYACIVDGSSSSLKPTAQRPIRAGHMPRRVTNSPCSRDAAAHDVVAMPLTYMTPGALTFHSRLLIIIVPTTCLYCVLRTLTQATPPDHSPHPERFQCCTDICFHLACVCCCPHRGQL
jgi:hypothetical protein